MAKLIPDVNIKEITVKSERDVANWLVKLLPNDCIIYHSYPWLRTDRNDRGNTTLREGETDFVIVLPSHGVLVLEIKGGEIVYDQSNRSWDRVLPNGGLRSIQDPFEQVRRNLHYIKDAIKLCGYQGDNLPFSFGYAVAFTDCEYNGATPPGSEPAIIFSSSDLAYLDRRITTALNQWSRRDKASPLSKTDIKNISRAISPAFNLMPTLFRQIEKQEETLLRLTKEQSILMQFLGANNRACIEGVAGSGKTLLAHAHALSLAESGKKVLIVCYNKILAKWISETIPENNKENITAINFHALCDEWVSKAGLKFSVPRDNMREFWNVTASDLLCQAIEFLPERFDAVIVDEGQDFQPNWWMPLELINTNEESGDMFVFYDSRQNLYVEQKDSMPDLGNLYKLPTNCRNTQSIASKCSSILDIDVPTRNSAPVGAVPVELTLTKELDIKKKVEQQIQSWINKGKLKPSQIVILSPWTKAKSSCKAANKIAGVEIVESVDEWNANQGILFSTIKSFKGLESDAIVVIDVPVTRDGIYFKDADYYVACSRAKHLLTVIYKN